ncbi:MAG: uroporphyrinogen-III C-methyltransferase, partial [Pseudomonadales bacterium]|nr:uroporphyrinogen-III C-methyltransferase [Pseudomonadales bacterium]
MSASRDEDELLFGSGDDAASGTAAASPPDAAPAPPRPSRAPLVIAVLALLAALGAAGAAAWPWWQARQGQDPASALAARVAGLEARLDERVATITAAADRAEASAAALRAELEGLEAREASFAELREAFADLSAEVAGTRPVDEPRWRIAEAHYLLRIANQRARMERDPEGARSLLEAADAILAELDDYGLFPVREAIADALAALRARGGVDRVGLYLELEALEAQVDALPAGRPEFSP